MDHQFYSGSDLRSKFGRIKKPLTLPYKANTLSVVMIVKNEVNNIAKAVESFSAFADEIVVNDTGSTDGTQDLLKNLGVKWFQSEWKNDFSLARNQAIEKATSSWVIWMDADDRVPEESVPDLLKLKTAVMDRMFGFQVINTQAGKPVGARFMQIRMFPNHPKLRFQRKIHEQIVYSAADLGLYCFYLETKIYHTGYEDENLKKTKALRNLDLAKSEMQLAGVDPTFTMSLGDSNFILENWEEGIRAYKLAYEIPNLKEINNDVYYTLPTYIGIGYKKLKNYSEAQKWLRESLNINPEQMEPIFHLGEIAEECNNLKEAENHYQKVINMPLRYSSAANQYDLFRIFSFHHLSNIYIKQNEFAKALPVLNQMESHYPDIIEAWEKKGLCLIKLEKYIEAESSLLKGIELNPKSNPKLYTYLLELYQITGQQIQFEDLQEKAKTNIPNFQFGPVFEKKTTSNTTLPNISLCMIVKNEEKNLGHCLESVKNIFQEIIIVDTGSSDGTINIAKSYGAKVFERPWDFDFSKARNHSIEKAAGDYIFWLDADDVLTPEDGRLISGLRKNLNLQNPKAYGFLVHNSSDGGKTGSIFNQIRLFPNREDLRFSSPIHEQILPALEEAKIEVEYKRIKIIHRGYSDPLSNIGKQERNKTILEKQIEDNNHVTAVTWYTLAMANMDLKNYKEAIEQFKKALQLAESMGNNPHIVEAVPIKVAAALGELKMYTEAKEVIQFSLNKEKPFGEALFVKAKIEEFLNNWEEAYVYYQRLLDLEEGPSFIPLDVNMLKIKACEFLGKYWHQKGRDDVAMGIMKMGISIPKGGIVSLREIKALEPSP